MQEWDEYIMYETEDNQSDILMKHSSICRWLYSNQEEKDVYFHNEKIIN